MNILQYNVVISTQDLGPLSFISTIKVTPTKDQNAKP